MAKQAQIVLIDWADNAGPVDMYMIDKEVDPSDPINKDVSVQFTGRTGHTRLFLKTSAHKDKWLPLGVLKYGIR